MEGFKRLSRLFSGNLPAMFNLSLNVFYIAFWLFNLYLASIDFSTYICLCFYLYYTARKSSILAQLFRQSGGYVLEVNFVPTTSAIWNICQIVKKVKSVARKVGITKVEYEKPE